ncbi:MAG: DUF4037 domain-containing protein [Clostridium sp.]|nr:DUF4037 domain-containing protein [Clostridium sp.]
MNIEEIMKGLDLLFDNRQGDRIEEYLSTYLEQALKEGDVGSAITIINELIGFYRDTSQYEKAEAYCEKLLPFMERAGLKDTVHYGTSCLNIANAYRASGRLEDSLFYYRRVFDIYDKNLKKNDFLYASLNNNLSLLYQEMGEFDKACEALVRALEIVKQYPDSVVELAVTYTNLAASYVKAGRLAKAKENAELGLAVFRDGLTEDFHYSAALSVAGDIRYAGEEYPEAAECYEQAMIALKKHVGLTHGYFRIVSNLQICYEAMGKADALNGLTLSRDYYEQFGKEAFGSADAQWNQHYGRDTQELNGICFAKLGEGSECFGFDDLLSKDHDFGPGFGILVTRRQYEQYGKELEEIYSKLPENFRGFSRPEPIAGAPRSGVIVVEDFLGRVLALSGSELNFLLEKRTLPEEVWLRIEDWRLKTVTNGEIFDGSNSVYENVYSVLKKGYPTTVWRRRIAQKLGEICQSGQYNYQRLMVRQDLYGAILMLHDFERAVVEFLFLINSVYAPHEKWIMTEAETLSKGQNILKEVKELMKQSPEMSSYLQRDMVDWIGTVNREDVIVEMIDRIGAEIVALLKVEGLTESNEAYLEMQIPYLLTGCRNDVSGDE